MKGKFARTRGRRGFRRFKRRFYRKRFSKKSSQRVYRFTRHCDISPSLLSNINPTFGSINFSLNDLPNYTEFTSLYDMYKINAVTVTFIPQMTENVSAVTLNNPYANTRFYSCIDYNDNSPPTTIDEVRQYQNCKVTSILRMHKRYIYKPKVLDAGGYTFSPWISTAFPSNNYYGLKYAVESTQATGALTFEFKIEAKFYMSFKIVK